MGCSVSPAGAVEVEARSSGRKLVTSVNRSVSFPDVSSSNTRMTFRPIDHGIETVDFEHFPISVGNAGFAITFLKAFPTQLLLLRFQ
jgi:hypothetical protein